MTRLTPSFVSGLLLVCAVGALTTSAAAQTEPSTDAARQRAAALKEQGNQAMDALKYDDALKDYQQAYEAFPDPSVIYNEARAYQARGEYPAALAAALRFNELASPELKARVPGLAKFVQEVQAQVATVDIQCNVAGSRILIRQTQVGMTPLAGPIKINAGHPLVEVIAEGYLPFHQEVDLRGGVTTPLHIELKSKEHAGTLAIRVEGDPATVEIDHLPLQMTPLELQLDAGQHSIVLQRQGFNDLNTSAVVVAGERKELSLELTRRKAITGQWWFWTGVSAVVVGAAVVGIVYAATTEKSPGTGVGFTPGTQPASALVKW